MNTSQFFKNNLFTKIFKSPQYGQLNKHLIKNPWMNFKMDGRNLSRAGNQSSAQLNDGNCIIEGLLYQVVVDWKAKQSREKAKQSKAKDGELCFIPLPK